MVTPQAYIAGPYTGAVSEHVWTALRSACIVMQARGWLPIVPHAMGLHHGVTWDEAMGRCREIIRALDPARDCMVLVPGWENSRGACEERDLALSLGLPVHLLSEVV